MRGGRRISVLCAVHVNPPNVDVLTMKSPKCQIQPGLRLGDFSFFFFFLDLHSFRDGEPSTTPLRHHELVSLCITK